MSIQEILGSDFGKDAFKTKVNGNFTEIVNQLADKLPNSHDTDETAHTYIRESINSFAPHLSDIVTDIDGVHGLQIESGTFTPVLSGLTTAGNNTYAYQVGIYKKIGNRVFIDIAIGLSLKDAAMVGDIVITGLPFAIKGVAYYRPSASIAQFAYIAYGTAKSITANAPAYNNRIDLQKTMDNAQVEKVTAADLINASSIVLSISYEV